MGQDKKVGRAHEFAVEEQPQSVYWRRKPISFERERRGWRTRRGTSLGAEQGTLDEEEASPVGGCGVGRYLLLSGAGCKARKGQ